MADLTVSADVDAMMASANNAAIISNIGAASLSGNQTFTGDQIFSGQVDITGGLTVDTDTLIVDSASNKVAIGGAVTSRALHIYGTVQSSSFGVFPQIYCDVFKDSSPGLDALNLSSRTLIASDGSTSQLRWSTAGTLTNVANVDFATGKQISFTDNSGTWNGATITGDQSFSGQVEATGQAASTDDSVMTRSLGDDRYRQTITDRQTSDQSITSTTTDTDTQLSISLEASSTYIIETMTYYTAASTTPGGWETPSYSGTFASTPQGQRLQYEGAGGVPTIRNYAGITGGSLVTGQTGWHMTRSGVVETSTAGTFKLTFKQNTSSGDAVTIKQGSYIRATKID